MGWDIARLFRHKDNHISHDAKISIERSYLVQHLGVFVDLYRKLAGGGEYEGPWITVLMVFGRRVTQQMTHRGKQKRGRLAGTRLRFALDIVTGQGNFESPGESQRLSDVLTAKSIRHELDLWGHDMPHDWPTWREMLPNYLETRF